MIAVLEPAAVTRFAALANLPAELRGRRQFVAWNLEAVEGRSKPTKVPYTVGRKASTTSPADWLTFEDACALADGQHLSGVGYVFAADGPPTTGLDFDGMDWVTVKPLVRDLLPAYVEVSQSGHGVHLICPGALPPGARRKGSIEAYDRGRFFALTGQLPDGVPPVSSLEDRTASLAAFHAQHLGGSPATTAAPANPDALTPEDEALILTIRAGSHGREFLRLFDAGEHHPNKASEADFDLAALLCAVTADEDQVVRIMAASALLRDKWSDRRGPITWLRHTVRAVRLRVGPVIDAARSATDAGPLWVPAAELAANPTLLQLPESLSPWLVWRGDLSLLVGREKRGKSTLAASDATAALRQGGRVLWVSAEEGPNRIVSRFLTLQAPLERLTLLRRWPQSWAEVEAAVTACQPDAVYVDSLSSFLTAVDGEVPQTSEGELWQAKVLRFKRWTTLAPDHPCGVTVLVHATKADGAYRGSTGIGAAPDTIITLRDVSQDPNARQLETVGRWGFPSKLVRFQDEAAGYVDGGGGTAEPAARLTAERQKVLGALVSGMTWGDWLAVYQGNRNGFSTAVRWLKAHGRIIQREDRTYHLAPPDPEF